MASANLLSLVLAYADNVTSEAPFFFRTYWMPSISRTESMRHGEIVRNQGPAPKLPIWQVARATAAAPGYFPEIKIQTETGTGSQTRRFKDGGFGTNNPSREAYHDIVTKHGGHSKSVGLFISIGTGLTPFDMFDRKDGFWKMPGFWRRPYANLKAAIRLPSRTLGAHEDVMYYSHHDDKDFFPYYRFDGGKKLGELTMDEWKSYRAPHLRGKNKVSGCITIEKIESAIATYLVRRDVQKALEACAKLLVRRRRLRTRDESAWDRYASASYYECKYKGCERSRINTAQDYKEHVRTRHQFLGVDQAVTNTMRDSRHCWIYRGQSTPVVAPSQSTVDLRTTESTRLPAAITVAGALQNSEEAQ